MKHCKPCDIFVDSPLTRCPLCYMQLTPHNDNPEPASYPDLKSSAVRYNLMLRIFLFLSLTAGIVCLTVNLLANHQYWWSLIVIANILYMWIALGTALKKNLRIGLNIIIQVLSLSALVVLIGSLLDFSKIVFNYVLPGVFMCAMITISIIVIVRRIDIQSFILYFVLMALLGFIPISLMAFDLVTVLWPSLVSALYAGLSLCSLFIFADNATKMELKKRLHL